VVDFRRVEIKEFDMIMEKIETGKEREGGRILVFLVSFACPPASQRFTFWQRKTIEDLALCLSIIAFGWRRQGREDVGPLKIFPSSTTSVPEDFL